MWFIGDNSNDSFAEESNASPHRLTKPFLKQSPYKRGRRATMPSNFGRPVKTNVSAYNLFFQHEEHILIHGLPGKPQRSRGHISPATRARVIEAKWKVLLPERKAYFETLAAIETERLRKEQEKREQEMAEYEHHHPFRHSVADFAGPPRTSRPGPIPVIFNRVPNSSWATVTPETSRGLAMATMTRPQADFPFCEPPMVPNYAMQHPRSPVPAHTAPYQPTARDPRDYPTTNVVPPVELTPVSAFDLPEDLPDDDDFMRHLQDDSSTPLCAFPIDDEPQASYKEDHLKDTRHSHTSYSDSAFDSTGAQVFPEHPIEYYDDFADAPRHHTRSVSEPIPHTTWESETRASSSGSRMGGVPRLISFRSLPPRDDHGSFDHHSEAGSAGQDDRPDDFDGESMGRFIKPCL